jgi:5'-3' exonuclease
VIRARDDDEIDEVIVYSLDADLLQLVRFDGVKVLHPKGDPLGREYVIEKFGVTPELLQTYKALVGDPSDGYKGVKGIGPKKAASLINEHGDLFEIYKALDAGKLKGPIVFKLKAGREHALLCWKLAALRYVDYHVRRSVADRRAAQAFIMSARIREGLDPDVFESLIEEA